MVPAPGIAVEVVAIVERALAKLGFVAGLQTTGPIVPGPVADAMLQDASAQLDDDSIGVTVATHIAMGSLGPLDYGLITSATLREGLERTVRHYAAVTQRARLVLDGATLRYERVPAIDHSRHWIEFAFAMIATRIRQTTGTHVAFHDVAFRHAGPARRNAYFEFFGNDVAFDAATDRMAFDPALLDQPLLTASRCLAELLERELRTLVPERSAADPMLDAIRHTLGELLDRGEVSLDSLAAARDTSRRTLQRTLALSGTSHSMLLDELRCRRAIGFLEAGHRVEDVAERLGFAEPSSFFRAYRRWTGTSPGRRQR